MRNTGLEDDRFKSGARLQSSSVAVATRETVLLVEDDEALSVGVSEHLRARGFDVTSVIDGVSAMDKLRAADFDVMLLDLGMPRMSGDHLLNEIKHIPSLKGLPVVLFTGSDKKSVERAARHGVFAVHGKPADLRLVAQSLRSAVYYG